MRIKSETTEEIILEDRGLILFSIYITILGIWFFFIHSSFDSVPLLKYFIGTILVLSGCFIFLLNPFYSVDITKTTLHYIRKTYIGHDRYVDQTYDSTDIDYIAVALRGIGCRTFMVLKDGKMIPMDSPNSPQSKEKIIAQKVATLLGVPFKAIRRFQG